MRRRNCIFTQFNLLIKREEKSKDSNLQKTRYFSDGKMLTKIERYTGFNAPANPPEKNTNMKKEEIKSINEYFYQKQLCKNTTKDLITDKQAPAARYTFELKLKTESKCYRTTIRTDSLQDTNSSINKLTELAKYLDNFFPEN